MFKPGIPVAIPFTTAGDEHFLSAFQKTVLKVKIL